MSHRGKGCVGGVCCRGHGREPGLPAGLRDRDVGCLTEGLEPWPPLGEIGAVHMHLGVANIALHLLWMGHDEHPAVLGPPGPAEEMDLLTASELEQIAQFLAVWVAYLLAADKYHRLTRPIFKG